ncbi:MAG TPA: DUF2255 family protein [Acidimicrobiia bacterium]|nr:DUF2255 family protein [Acidimicrobiia bacterium]
MSLTAEQLQEIGDSQLVIIETRRGDRVTGTVIWVVVVDDVVYVRSVRGESGRWYQRAVADAAVALRVGDDRFEFRAIPANDPDSVESASEGLRRKYRGRSLENMLLPETLGTTLRLEPR